MEDNFSWTAGRGWFQDDSNTLHLLGTLGCPIGTWWLSGKECTYNAGAVGNLGLIPESGRSPEGGKYSFLETPMDRGAW